MSECPAFDDLNALADTNLAPEREAELRQHLKQCANCRSRFEEINALKRAVGRAYDDEVPAPLLRRVVSATLSKRRRKR